MTDRHPAPAPVDPITALTDDNLLAPMLPGVHDGSWDNWLVIVRGLYGMPMTDEQAATWRQLTDREPPSEPLRSAFMLVGRRGGKTQIAAALTLYETAMRDWSNVRSAGELIVGAMVAGDRRQAGQAMRYISGGLDSSSMLKRMVVKETTEAIELSNGTEVTVMTANHRTIRSRSFGALICDEIGHWYQEGASPDVEIVRAAEPALSLTNGLLLGASTPHKRDGVLHSKDKRHWGDDESKTLIVHGTSRQLNPRLPQSVVDEAMAEDEAAARSEYLAEWRDDLAGFIQRDVLEALVDPDVTEREPDRNTRYRAFIDVSGGVGDSFCWAVAHSEDGVDILDLVKEVKPPFDPLQVTMECAEDLKRYKLRRAAGDAYAAEWVTSHFRRCGIEYDRSDKNRSQIYLDALPRLTSGKVTLLDNQRLINQVAALERRTRSGGRDSVDHPRNGSDDVANAALGAICGQSRDRSGWIQPMPVAFPGQVQQQPKRWTPIGH
ncbi:hypothetical protein DES49_1598 [Halospina denitrificans]|uniref:Phage terminase large subunit-like protein n=1 Tax=Halospina denitrificans TaxID=332522 RepID=A0A4R7JVP4_9GAMM|nr:hypothetical protein [Halospina denitrificans]TDT41503.1 hypothetical protein DES49_1598 [Halospina denitrificans]